MIPPTSPSTKDHAFSPPLPGDSRSPCPALNTLANHGFLPHDGRNMSVAQLVKAVEEGYNISAPFAWVLAAGGVMRCGKGGKLDLHDLARHNVIEHDGSLVHPDTPSGCLFASTSVDQSLLQHLLDSSSGDHLTFHDLVAFRAERDVAVSTPLTSVQTEITKGELALIFEVFGIRGTDCMRSGGRDYEDIRDVIVPKTFVEQWFGREKLPDGWHKPLNEVGLREVVSDMETITEALGELGKA